MIGFVVFDLVFQYLAKILAGKNVSEMTCFCRVGRKTLINHFIYVGHTEKATTIPVVCAYSNQAERRLGNLWLTP